MWASCSDQSSTGNGRGGSKTRPAGGQAVQPSNQPRRRRQSRLRDYDYATPSAYFLTVCTDSRVCLFMDPRSVKAVRLVWERLEVHYEQVRTDAFVVMPNHIHGIVFLTTAGENRRSPSLPDIVRAFKSFSAREVNAIRGMQGSPVWQRGYFEHIIRNEQSLNRIRQYILANPDRWTFDKDNPQAEPDALERAFWTDLEAEGRRPITGELEQHARAGGS